ncbi:MAG TPA: pyridoxamine 5'-phosphate oxidase family protein [Streptosporangiaceae bacterium]|nr:pyridoxamine 5'-phosphate oxidase family protein [Streptosporangiaceae bacterium]
MSESLGSLQDRTFARSTAATAISYPPERRLSAAQLASYLERRAFAVVSSTRANGRPHTAMSLFYRRDVTFWLPTMAGSVRERNLRETPWLTMVVAEGDDPVHIAVIIEGPAEVVAPPQVPADLRAAVTGDWVSSWIRLTAERLLSYADESAQP